MTDLMAARLMMAMTLGFHILFAVVGIGMPLAMILAEGLWLRTRDSVCLDLARRWSRGTAIFFAVGAVSGTVLSFELGLLWPLFMVSAGPVIGMPFSLEGFAFFLEAIFLGIYLYGWDRVPPRMHWFSGGVIVLGGTLSAVFVVTANAWMNTPAGFDRVGGRFVNIDPFAAMFNPAAFGQCLHMVLAAFQAVGFAVAGIHAFLLLRWDVKNPFHRRAAAIGFWIGTVASVLMPVSGDVLARQVAKYQPVKLAAMEGQWETERGAPLRLGGWPDEKREITPYALEIPKALSLLAYHDPGAEVGGLKAVPSADRPPVAVVHIAFQIMIGSGLFMVAVGLLGLWLFWREGGFPDRRWFLRLLVFCTPLGFIAVLAGWVVTEVGRQPWIIYRLMRTAEAVTSTPRLVVPFFLFGGIYLILSITVLGLFRRELLATKGDPHATP